ncbi:MAG TPA: hypothetical protein VLK65_04335, partial [Vicinamibacteria bacterium]|nr:hypothetical protein [Vicinamibacteria bacterium]
MKELFATVQKRCPPEAWSRGVALARSHAVTVESDEEDEVVARVRVMGGAVAPTVSLYPEELEWECDCQGPLDACEHVAAVIIAKRLGTIGSSESRPVLYRLSRRRGGLFLERGVEEEGSFVPIEHPLEAIASGTFHGPLFDAKPADLEVDRALRGRFSGLLERGAIERVFRALAGSKHVSFDGAPVDVSGAPIVSPVLVEDAGEGFRLRMGEATGEPFVLHNGCLHPTKDPALSGREREELTRGRFFGPDEVATLAGEVLPSLKKRTAVDVRTRRLPKAGKSPPRLTFLLQRNGDRLYVLPRIRYAEPVPLRDFDAERRLQDEL